MDYPVREGHPPQALARGWQQLQVRVGCRGHLPARHERRIPCRRRTDPVTQAAVVVVRRRGRIAGGVGSVMIQLAKALTGVRVIATASRPGSRDWAASMGADVVINHHNLRAEAVAVAPDGVDWLSSPHPAGNVVNCAEILNPFGHVAVVDDPENLNLMPLKDKSIAWHWELMFTKPLYGLAGQQDLIARAARLVDDGLIRSTVSQTIQDFSASGLREAHRAVESGHMVGKIVVHR